jgi:hypothetical protein
MLTDDTMGIVRHVVDHRSMPVTNMWLALFGTLRGSK